MGLFDTMANNRSQRTLQNLVFRQEFFDKNLSTLKGYKRPGSQNCKKQGAWSLAQGKRR